MVNEAVIIDDEFIEEDILEEEDLNEEVEDDIEPEVEVEGEAETEDEEEDVIEIDGEESLTSEEDEVSKAPLWVKDLRKSHREQQRENRKLKEELSKLQTPASEKKQPLMEKPTLDGSDYDTDVYEANLAKWYEAKREQDELERKQRDALKEQEQAWQNTLNGYTEKKAKLKVRDFDDAEIIVQDELDNTQQGLILQGADDPALVVYALGKNPKKMQELKAIKDPVKFSFAVAKLETTLKVSKRKVGTKPEQKITGNSRLSGSVDSNLERLRSEAARTGDYTKVTQYKRQKASK